MWPLLPVLQAAGAVMPDQDWLVLAKNALTQRSFILVANRAGGGDERQIIGGLPKPYSDKLALLNWPARNH